MMTYVLPQSRLILIDRLALQLDPVAHPQIILDLIQILRPHSGPSSTLHISTSVVSPASQR